MIFGTDVALRALGAALAGLSILFAAYMLADGGYKIRVNGMEHLAIFAQPRGARSREIRCFSRPRRRRWFCRRSI